MKLTSSGIVPAEADGRAGIASADKAVHLPGIQTGSHEGWLDLTRYHGEGLIPYSAYGQGKLLLSKPIMQIGDEALLRASGANGDRLAAVNSSSREVTVLDIAPGHINLASDGHYLLMQEYGKAGGDAFGGAWLVDLHSKKILNNWTDKRFRESAFLAFTPSGQLVFQGFVENTGLTFAPTVPDNAFLADK